MRKDFKFDNTSKLLQTTFYVEYWIGLGTLDDHGGAKIDNIGYGGWPMIGSPNGDRDLHRHSG